LPETRTLFRGEGGKKKKNGKKKKKRVLKKKMVSNCGFVGAQKKKDVSSAQKKCAGIRGNLVE